jgi:hypothetical protein
MNRAAIVVNVGLPMGLEEALTVVAQTGALLLRMPPESA